MFADVRLVGFHPPIGVEQKRYQEQGREKRQKERERKRRRKMRKVKGEEKKKE